MRLDSRLMVGVGFWSLDTWCASATALVFFAGGPAADAVVCDLVLRAGAVFRTLIGLDAILRLRFTTRCGWTGNCAAVGRACGADVCTLGVGVCVYGALLVMDLVTRMFVGALAASTLGTGGIVVAGVCLMRCRFCPVVWLQCFQPSAACLACLVLR
jgi:hypothetical protein